MNLKKLESRCRKYGRTSDVLALSAGCWLEGALGQRPGGLLKAEALLNDALAANPVSAPLLLMSVFVHIESGDYPRAAEKLYPALRYRAFFRQSAPLYHGALIFLQAYLESRRDGRVRNAGKTRKRLAAAAGAHPVLYAASAMLHMEAGDRKSAFADLLESYRRGCASPFLYAALWRFYGDGASPSDPLVCPFLLWALAHGADLRPVSRFTDCVEPEFFADGTGRLLARDYPHPDLLRKLCAYYIGARDYSEEARAAYKKAEDRQIAAPGLPESLIRASRINGAEDIGRYTMENYLKSPAARSETDAGLRAFVFHLILTDPRLAEFIVAMRNDMLRFGAFCLENGLEGRHFNSVYLFFAAGGGADGADRLRVQGLVKRARQMLKKALFLYEVRFADPESKVTRLLVYEKERAEPELYDVGKNAAYVLAASRDFTCVGLTGGGRGVSGEVPAVTAMLENPGSGLLWSFFDEGERMFPLLARLGNEILEGEASGAAIRPEKAVPVLTALLESGLASAPLKSSANAVLGGIMQDGARYDEALAYYSAADENFLDGRRIERMLAVFVNAGQWERAGGIVAGKADLLSDRALFHAAEKIAQSQSPAAVRAAAGAAYGLLIRNWYDRRLLELALGHYAGSRAQWQELSRVLAAASFPEPELDAMILRQSVQTRGFDAGSERVFGRLFKNSPGDPAVGEYAYYCVYEMIVNKVRPSYETLLILEKLYDEGGDWLLAVALSHVYLTHGITTFRSEAILADALAEQEKLGILFPVFQGNRDKTGASAYIEKNRAFLYRGLPGKDVRLCYKVDDEAVYRTKKMRYIRFGVYLCVIPHFYGESVSYHFSETLPTGSVSTKEESVKNTGVYIAEDSDDPYFAINNALVYEQMFRYDQAEKIIAGMVREKKSVNARIV